jgi:AbrB family looped-hinge helix DNA binding protein
MGSRIDGEDDAHSTVSRKGQTTIPGAIRDALKIKPGDRLVFVVEGDHATIRVRLGTRSLKGALASRKGKWMSFAQIRESAARSERIRWAKVEQAQGEWPQKSTKGAKKEKRWR